MLRRIRKIWARHLLAAGLLAGSAGGAHALVEITACACICAGTPPYACILPGTLTPTPDLVRALAQWLSTNRSGFSAWALGIWTPGDPCVTEKCNSAVGAYKFEGSRLRGSLSKQFQARQQMSDFMVSDGQQVQISSTSSEAEVETIRAVLPNGGDFTGVCKRAAVSQAAGQGQVLAARRAQSAAIAARAADRGRIPAREVSRTNDLRDRERTPDFMGATGGTLSLLEQGDAAEYIREVLPLPPDVPTRIPAAMKGTATSKAYEKAHTRTEGTRLLATKMLARELTLSTAAIEVDDDYLSVWDDITSGLPPAPKTGRDEKSRMPDMSHRPVPDVTRDPSTQERVQQLSERDYLRTEVYRRYMNPMYQSDADYGLAGMATEADVLREIIAVAASRNRMLYEIMASSVHLTGVLAVERANRHGASRLESLSDLYIEATVN